MHIKIRELFQKRVLVSNSPTRYKWQNKQWFDILLAILIMATIYGLACLFAIAVG